MVGLDGVVGTKNVVLDEPAAVLATVLRLTAVDRDVPVPLPNEWTLAALSQAVGLALAIGPHGDQQA